ATPSSFTAAGSAPQNVVSGILACRVPIGQTGHNHCRRSGAQMSIAFTHNARPTIGVELELHLV
ncbi:hypothetical protein, partial [Ilumatobacter sp.]